MNIFTGCAPALLLGIARKGGINAPDAKAELVQQSENGGASAKAAKEALAELAGHERGSPALPDANTVYDRRARQANAASSSAGADRCAAANTVVKYSSPEEIYAARRMQASGAEMPA